MGFTLNFVVKHHTQKQSKTKRPSAIFSKSIVIPDAAVLPQYTRVTNDDRQHRVTIAELCNTNIHLQLLAKMLHICISSILSVNAQKVKRTYPIRLNYLL